MNACLEKEFLKDKRLLSTEHTQWVQILSERAFEHALAFSHIHIFYLFEISIHRFRCKSAFSEMVYPHCG